MTRPSAQSGFGLLAAIFLLVAMALAAAVMASLVGVERRTVDLAVLQSRAYQSARSGVEWGIWQALNAGFCSALPTAITLTEGGLVGFGVSVSCEQSTVSENALTFNIYKIRALAQRGTVGDRDYVSRDMEATVTDAP